MRIVILCSSVYSETACAMASHLARSGYIACGAITLPAFDRGTLVRKLNQWGVRQSAAYARAKLMPGRSVAQSRVDNPYLESFLKNGKGMFRNLKEVAGFYGFPLAVCKNQNAPESITRMREWSPDLIVFTGGNILGQPVLDLARLGVLNVHLGLLPEIRGMSSPEWSLLRNLPLGVTIHYMDAGIDTGPILQRFTFPDAAMGDSLCDVRHRLICFGVEKIAEVVRALDRGTISPAPQSDRDSDLNDRGNQYFVMHERLRARAAQCLTDRRFAPVRGAVHG